MSRKRRNKQSRNQPRPTEQVRRRPWGVGVLILAVAAVLVGIALWPHLGARTERQSAATPPATEAATSPNSDKPAAKNESASGEIAAAKPDISKLKGRWRRAGEQYVLEVHDIDESGKVDAAYFNPQPIHVGRAAVQQEQGAVVLFVELRDAGYPGCTYTLFHDPANDQLVGVYYQAAMQERYEVVFERIQ
jgi:hypothetical protein